MWVFLRFLLTFLLVWYIINLNFYANRKFIKNFWRKKLMKKIALLLALVMVAMCAFTACNAGTKDGETVTKITVATGGSTGTYYAYGMAMGSILQEKTGLTFDVQSTGASKANIQLIQAGEVDMAVVQNDVMYYAYTGTDLFEGAQTQDFAAIGTLYPELCQIVASKASGIESIADLKGKRVSVGDAGSGVEFNAKQILEAYGIDMNADIDKQNLGFGPSADALRDEKIDAFFCVAGIPTTAITDLAMGTDIVVLSVDDAEFDKLTEKYDFYTKQIIPAGTYAGVEEDVQTVAVMATYIVDKDLPEEVVYNITKAIFENKDAIAAAHVKGEELDSAKAVEGIAAVPFHAGAIKYFTEIGVMEAAE